MRAKLQIERINDRDFVIGYGFDADSPDHPELDGIVSFLDEYRNPKYELLADGRIVEAAIVPSQDQLDMKAQVDSEQAAFTPSVVLAIKKMLDKIEADLAKALDDIEKIKNP